MPWDIPGWAFEKKPLGRFEARTPSGHLVAHGKKLGPVARKAESYAKRMGVNVYIEDVGKYARQPLGTVRANPGGWMRAKAVQIVRNRRGRAIALKIRR